MIKSGVLSGMVRAINSFPDLNGCQIALYGDNQCSMVQSGVVASAAYGNVMIMIEELTITDAAVNADTARWLAMPDGTSPPGPPNASAITNESRLGAELTGMGISCAMTIASGALMVAGGATTIPTGGAGIVLFVAGWVGLATSAVQCGNAIARVMEASEHPKDDSLNALDNDKSNRSYQLTMLIVDAVGVAAAVASLPSGIKSLWSLLKTQRYWASRGLTEAAFKGTSKAERLAIMRELMKEASATPEGRAALEVALKEAKLTPQAIEAGTARVVKSAATKVLKAVSANTMKRLQFAVASVVSGAAGPLASGLESRSVASASGSVNWIIHVLDGSD